VILFGRLPAAEANRFGRYPNFFASHGQTKNALECLPRFIAERNQAQTDHQPAEWMIETRLSLVIAFLRAE
jgi:hypothetical protein